MHELYTACKHHRCSSEPSAYELWPRMHGLPAQRGLSVHAQHGSIGKELRYVTAPCVLLESSQEQAGNSRVRIQYETVHPCTLSRCAHRGTSGLRHSSFTSGATITTTVSGGLPSVSGMTNQTSGLTNNASALTASADSGFDGGDLSPPSSRLTIQVCACVCVCVCVCVCGQA